MEQQYPPGTNENYCSFSLRIPVTQNDTKLDKDCLNSGRGSKGSESTKWAQLDDLRSSEPGVPPKENTFSRKATMEDFFDDGVMPAQNNKYNKNHSRNDNGIEKNQQEFGHKKRIKP